MPDIFHRFLKWIDHNRSAVAALIAGPVVTLVILVGCTPKTASLIDPTRTVTVDQFEQEGAIVAGQLEQKRMDLAAQMAALEARAQSKAELAELGWDDLQRQFDRNTALIEALGGAVTAVATGQFTPDKILGLGLTLTSILGVGGVALDNRRKDRLIKTQKGQLDAVTRAA